MDFSVCDTAVLLTGYHEAEFQFNIEPTVDTAEYLSIVVPRSGGMGVTYGSRVAEAGQGKLLLYNNFEPNSVIMHGRSNVIDELLINWPLILQTIGQTFEMPFSGSLDLLPELDLSKPEGRLINNLTETIISGMRDDGPLLQSPIAMAHMTQALADLVVRLVPHRLSHFLENGPALIAPRHVRRAIEFMHANIDQPITMPKVAEAAKRIQPGARNRFSCLQRNLSRCLSADASAACRAPGSARSREQGDHEGHLPQMGLLSFRPVFRSL